MDDGGSVFVDLLLPLALACIMFSLGLGLTVGDFRRIFTAPRAVLIGLLNLLLISPLLAFGSAEVFGLSAGLAVGLVLLGASPGGTTSNMLTHLARGDTALSVTMTAISSLAAVLTIPLFLSLAIDWFDAQGITADVEATGIALRVFLITVLPLSIGMAVRSRAPGWVERHDEAVKRAAIVAFVLVVVVAVVSEWETLRENFASVALACLALNVAAMTFSYNAARIAKLDRRQATAISLELGVHNATVAIAVGATVASVLTIPAAVYSGFMFITAGIFARWVYKKNEPAPAPV
jgi:bile acid:Na+ symporter, BASS family